MTSLPDRDWTGLIQDVCEGDASSRQQLLELLWPFWLDVLRTGRHLGPFRTSDDHVHNVATRLIAKLGAADGKALGSYLDWQRGSPEKTFEDWMRIVVANAARDYARAELGPRPKDPDVPSPKRLLNEFASSPLLEELGIRPPITAAQTARQLLDYATERLAEAQLRALELWLAGGGHDDIAAELGTTADEGRKLLRSGIAVLRRHFQENGEG